MLQELVLSTLVAMLLNRKPLNWPDLRIGPINLYSMPPLRNTEMSMSKKYPKYYKDIPKGVTELDVYGVCQMFPVDDPTGCINHARKKLLVPGTRTGGKSMMDDIREARDTLNRYLELVATEKTNRDEEGRIKATAIAAMHITDNPSDSARIMQKMTADIKAASLEFQNGLMVRKPDNGVYRTPPVFEAAPFKSTDDSNGFDPT